MAVGYEGPYEGQTGTHHVCQKALFQYGVHTRAVNYAMKMIKLTPSGIYYEDCLFPSRARLTLPSINEMNESNHFDKLDNFDSWIVVQEMRGPFSRMAHQKINKPDFLENVLIMHGNKPALEADTVYMCTNERPGLTVVRSNHKV